MNPSPLPLRRFHLVIVPRHDRLPPRANLVCTSGAIVNRLDEPLLMQAKERLQSQASFRPVPPAASAGKQPHGDADAAPVISVFIGGDTPQHELTPAFAAALIKQVKAVCDEVGAWCLLTTSRRTSPAAERVLSEELGRYPRCRLLLLVNRESVNGAMEGMLGCANVAVVTGESISMVSECCASGRQVVVVEPPLRAGNAAALTKHRRFLQDLVEEGYLRNALLPEVGLAIRRALAEREPAKRLETFAIIREAVSKLL